MALYALNKTKQTSVRKIRAKTIILRQDVDSYLSALPVIDITREGL